MDLCEFKASLVYKASSRMRRATQRNPVAKQNNNNINKQTYPVDSQTAASGLLAGVTGLASPPGSVMTWFPDNSSVSELAFPPSLFLFLVACFLE